MSNDPSGTHNLPPITHPERGVLSIDARTLVMAALFLFGGAGAGGGASMLGGSEVRDEVKALAVEVQALTRSVDGLKTEGRSVEREHEAFRLSISDHEARLRKIEEKRRP